MNAAVLAVLEKLKGGIPSHLAKILGINQAPPVPLFSPVLSDVLGVNGSITQANAKAMGVGAVRLTAQWSTIQAIPGSWEWGSTDAAIMAANASGLKVCLMLFGTPNWAGASGQPKNAVAIPDQGFWTSFVKAAVTRYVATPFNVKYFQLWNEPCMGAFLNGSLWDYATNILIPAAPLVRAGGGLVVFGGWPCDEWLWVPQSSLAERLKGTTGLYGMLKMNKAMADAIDVFDCHYEPLGSIETLFSDWVNPGTVAKAWGYNKWRGVWQTEMGYQCGTQGQGVAGVMYEDLLTWAKTAGLPNRDAVKFFWYAAVGPDDRYLLQVGEGSMWPNGQSLVALQNP